jgi:hypothetical protein
MDKPKYTIHKSIPHRKGIALLITLSVLAVIIALTGILLSYFDEVRKDASTTKALIQGNLYYADIQKIFKNFKKKKTLYSTLYLMPIPLSSPDGRFSILLTCHPLSNGVNINWLGLGNNQEMVAQYNAAQKVFDAVTQGYNLEDAGRLQEMLLEEIGGKEKFVKKEQSRLRQKNGIISLRQFEAILSRYQLEVDDQKVSRVPWSKLFTFSSTAKVIDGDYISAELLSLLFDIDLAAVKETWVAGEMKLKAFVQESGELYSQKLFAKEFLEEAACEVQYGHADERFRFKFVDIEGEVKDFEFYGKQ